jgi:hypothetical protein
MTVGPDYAYTIKSRLQKKLEHFTAEEMLLLVKHGSLTEFCKIAGPNLTENCKVSKDNVIQEDVERLSAATLILCSSVKRTLRVGQTQAQSCGGSLAW